MCTLKRPDLASNFIYLVIWVASLSSYNSNYFPFLDKKTCKQNY